MTQTYLEVHNLCKTFTAKNGSVEALKGVSLSIGKGEIFGVIGLSGAGKSTLVRCMNLLERPDSGDVLLNGESLLKLSKEQLRLRRQKIGMIFQHFNLLEQQTVLENVCFPLEIRGIPRKERREKALELLELAREDARQHRDNAGYLHLFAHLFVYTCEKSRGEMREQVRREYYDDVERAVEDAIRLDPAYAKFYCTKARVVAQRGRYAEAYSLINKAVATESSARKDYALRLLDYRHCETVILLQEQREYFQGEMEKLRRSVPSLPKPKTFVPGRGPKAYEGAEPYCFVSYAHINSDRVYPIVEQLMQRGIRLWYDDGIEAGSDFREFIAEKIRDSWQVLLFASHESIQPGFVRNEINYALHCGKPILRVNLDDVELTPGMELSLGGMQYVDATEPGGDYLERIVRTLLAERKEKA